MATWLHCDNVTKEIFGFGMSPTTEMALMQTPPAGKSLIVLPDGLLGNAFTSGGLDLTGLKVAMQAEINFGAETLRQKFITSGYGQMQSYLAKAAEAEAWTANNSAPIPIIHAEAVAVGKSDEEIVAEVLLAKQQWTIGEALINATRQGAKKAVSDADNVPDITAAKNIDWAEVETTIRSALGG